MCDINRELTTFNFENSVIKGDAANFIKWMKTYTGGSSQYDG